MAKSPDTRSAKLATEAKRQNNHVLAAAVAAWTVLDERAKRRLAYEVVEARHHELRLAYPDVLSIGHGFRVVGERRSAAGRRHSKGAVLDEPCVIFTVKAKRKFTRKSSAVQRRRHLPPCLLAHGTDPATGRRVLCAVPTDVRVLAELKSRPHGKQVRIERSPFNPQNGYVACAVRRSDAPGDLFALSCHHVFAMSKVTHPPGRTATGAVTMLEGSRQTIGTLDSNWIGALNADPSETSFDAALCGVASADVQALRDACGNIQPDRITDDPAGIPTFCEMTIGKRTVNLKFVEEHFAFDQIGYFPGGGVQPIQPRVLEFRVEAGTPPKGGDSGTAVMTSDGAEFVAMHIAGSNDGSATFALPAYELATGARYGNPGATLSFPKNW